MLKFYEPDPVITEELEQFEKDIQTFVSGEMNPIKFKAIRVAHGVYEQRERETYMIRIRCAAGGITPLQLKKVAEMGDQYGSGEVHFTTRQEVQIHDVKIEGVIPSIKGLLEVGLSSRGGGGNTIRNILTSADSGVSLDEEFDVDPYAISLTTRMINEPDSWNLPRKFKIAMSNSRKDTAYTQATCLGFVATVKEGQKGFEVYCSGGMGAKPMVGHQLIDWIPESQVYHVTKAIKIMFDKHGNRRSKFSNRIKFLWKKLGEDAFKTFFYEEYNKIKDDASLALDLPNVPNAAKETINLAPQVVDSEAFKLWKSRFVFDQKQEGLKSVKIPLRLGDLLREDADKLCDFLEEIGENTIRCDRAQNMRLRNIPENYLGNLYTIIQDMKMTLADLPAFIANMINCTGAQTCKLGICLPRGLSDAIRNRLVDSNLNLDEITDFQVNMSGCPNTCGMHHIADLGFFGKIGRKNGEIYPSYNVLAGAKRGVVGYTEYGKRLGDVSAKFIPDFLHDFLDVWISEKSDHEDYHAFLETKGRDFIKALCEKYKDIPTLEENPEFYQDWGAKGRMSLEEMGSAECSAGMFDMIEVDKKEIESLQKSIQEASGDKTDLLYKSLFHSARMLLVTRGLDAKTDQQVFELFTKHFVITELIDISFQDVLVLAKMGLKAELSAHEETILQLGQAIVALYKSMDDSLKFKTAQNSDSVVHSDLLKRDFRGVACPMNFVKTKLELENMASGQQLEILLDDGEPVQNVPNSVKLEGHTIVKQEKDNAGHWTVLIKKK